MTEKTPKSPQPEKTELHNHYRPIGLKAVIAAALMLKRKPATKPQPV